jgi:sporulation protein YlmC with PRC-barrel domain
MKTAAPTILLGLLLPVFNTTSAAAEDTKASAGRSSEDLQTASSYAPAQAAGIVRATDLVGFSVRNNEGEELGEVVDLAIDARLGRVSYAVLAFGGVLGIGERLYALPISALRFSANADYLSVDIPRSRLQASSGFDHEHWPFHADKQLLKRTEDKSAVSPSRSGAPPTDAPREQGR